jgi:dTDP-4-dehydrorhamnose reductase
MLAEVNAQMLAKAGEDPLVWLEDRVGVYHLGGSGGVSRLDWARAIIKFDPKPDEQVVEEVHPALTTEFPTPAKRPLHSVLNCDRFSDAFSLRLPHWELALQLAMENIE